jgi:hypothetical protein
VSTKTCQAEDKLICRDKSDQSAAVYLIVCITCAGRCMQATLIQPQSFSWNGLPAPARSSSLLATTHHGRRRRHAVSATMSSEASITYSGVAAHGSSRLHAGPVYTNVVNSERSLLMCIMRNDTTLTQYLRLFRRFCCGEQHSESQVATFTAKDARARRQSCSPRALQGSK